MFIDISEIISTDFKSCDFVAELDMNSLDYDGLIYPFSKKEPVKLTLVNEGNSLVRITGSFAAELLIPCDRCLKDVHVSFDFEIDQEIDFQKVHAGTLEDLDEIIFIEENSLDVDRLIRNELILHLPYKVLCKEDCAGLCPVCGRDLNEGDCGCNKASEDPRMSAIRDIFKNFKEV